MSVMQLGYGPDPFLLDRYQTIVQQVLKVKLINTYIEYI